jgi:hypothetical protein
LRLFSDLERGAYNTDFKRKNNRNTLKKAVLLQFVVSGGVSDASLQKTFATKMAAVASPTGFAFGIRPITGHGLSVINT